VARRSTTCTTYGSGRSAGGHVLPDAYMGRQGAADHIVELTTRYARSGKPFFTVEASDGDMGAAHAFYAIGQQRAIGYSGMGNDGLLEWFTRRASICRRR